MLQTLQEVFMCPTPHIPPLLPRPNRYPITEQPYPTTHIPLSNIK